MLFLVYPRCELTCFSVGGRGLSFLRSLFSPATCGRGPFHRQRSHRALQPVPSLPRVYPKLAPGVCLLAFLPGESPPLDSQQGNISSLALEFTLSLSPRTAHLTRSRGVCAYLLVCRGPGVGGCPLSKPIISKHNSSKNVPYPPFTLETEHYRSFSILRLFRHPLTILAHISLYSISSLNKCAKYAYELKSTLRK